MMFLPQAKCRTIVPDTFSMLLSQRRRWINSTIHNLMELVLVRNLCGTFCFSMQFVVFMDLVGTVVLPIAISLTYMLIVTMAFNPPRTFEEAIPLMLLVSVLGLPAILIMITTRKVIYIFWMMIYLVALPVWNFVLPVYAFWHFDDFSWGETRKVEGETKGEGHGSSKQSYEGPAVPMRRWEDWERSRLRKLRREDRRKKEFERSHPSGYHSENDLLSTRGDNRSMNDASDTYSLASSDDDHWGGQIGGYNENNAKYPPPPVGLNALPADGLVSAKTVDGSELEAMLELGFDDRPSPPPSATHPTYAPRYQLSDSTTQLIGGYAPMSRSASPGNAPPPPTLSPTTPRAVGAPGTGGRPPRPERDYGPLGPLDPTGGAF